MRSGFAAACFAALAAATAGAQASPVAQTGRIQLASLTVRESVVFVNAAPGPVTFGVSNGTGPWQRVTLQPGWRQGYSCSGCPGFKAGITTTSPQGQVIRRVEAPLESGYVYEIYYESRGNFYAFRRAGPAPRG